jgi:hypothetical protein
MTLGVDRMEHSIHRLVVRPAIGGNWVAGASGLAAIVLALASLLINFSSLGGQKPPAQAGFSSETRLALSEEAQAPVRKSGSPVPMVSHPIFSDTAMAPVSYSDNSTCQNHVRNIVDTVSKSHPLVSKPGSDGVYYASFPDKQNNYVLRCFRIDDSGYRLFMAGSGVEKFEVSEGLRWFYDAASAAL